MLRSHASKRLEFSPNPCFKLEEFKKPNISFKFSLHELKKGTPMHLISMDTLLKNPCLRACSIFRVNGKHRAHTLIKHIGNMALSSLSSGTCIQLDFRDHEWLSKIFDLGFRTNWNRKEKWWPSKISNGKDFRSSKILKSKKILEGYSFLPKEFPGKNGFLKLQQLIQASLNHYYVFRSLKIQLD